MRVKQRLHFSWYLHLIHIPWEVVWKMTFLIENSSSTVTSISLSGNLVTLTLSTAATESNAKLTYLGESQATVPYIFNQNNNGMLSFKDVLIGNF